MIFKKTFSLISIQIDLILQISHTYLPTIFPMKVITLKSLPNFFVFKQIFRLSFTQATNKIEWRHNNDVINGNFFIICTYASYLFHAYQMEWKNKSLIWIIYDKELSWQRERFWIGEAYCVTVWKEWSHLLANVRHSSCTLQSFSDSYQHLTPNWFVPTQC